MKKYFLLFSLLFSLQLSYGQYYKTLDTTRTEWDIFNAIMPISQGNGEKSSNISAPLVMYGRYTAFTNTVIGMNTYKKMYLAMPTTTTIGSMVGYIREDTVAKKVYFRDISASTDDLLYDYSLAVGDSIYYNFTSGYPFSAGYYKVKAIQNMTIKAGIRKQFKLVRILGSDTLRIVEGLGSLIHPLFLYKNFFAMGQLAFGSCYYTNYDLGLACKLDNYSKIFQSCGYNVALTNGCMFKLDSCNYWNTCGGIHELSTIKNLQVSPNPANNFITISFNSELAGKAEISIIDVSGRIITRNIALLVPGKNEIQNNVSNIESGTYFIKIKSEGVDAGYPLIISH